MKLPKTKFVFLCYALLLVSPISGLAIPYSGVTIFGDSLSDNGNVSILLGGATTPLPIPGNDFIPSEPYNRPAPLLPALSNGPIWAEHLANKLGLGLKPSLLGGSNYAFGGARLAGNGTVPPSVRDQVNTFLGAIDATPGPDAPKDSLYVVWGGGNDARDAVAAVLTTGDPNAADGFVTGFINDLTWIMDSLASEGVQQVLVPNIPDLGLTPAIQSIGSQAAATATSISQLFNNQANNLLKSLSGTLGLDIIALDVFGLINQAAANPAKFGLTNVTDACAADPNCIADPSGYLFWDGIHPTTATHAIIGEAALRVLPKTAGVPEPATWLLFLIGLFCSKGLSGQRKHSV